jgi:predicted DNA-binding transcriptional regulator AlpA
VSTQAVNEYLALIWEQYQVANSKFKSLLLDEVVKNTGLHRKAIIRLMNKKSAPLFRRGKGKSVNSYSKTAKKLLTKLWVDMGRLGSVRMKAAIPLWINNWKHKELDDYVKFE